jgi:hypothetical protein
MLRYIFSTQHKRRFSNNPKDNYVSPEWFRSCYPTVDWTKPEDSILIDGSHEKVPLAFKYTLTSSGTVANIKFKNMTENRTIYDISVDMSFISGQPAQTLWIFSEEFLDANQEENYTAFLAGLPPVNTLAKTSDLVSVHERSFISKSQMFLDRNSIICFMIETDNATIDDVLFNFVKPQSIKDNGTPYNAYVADPDNGLQYMYNTPGIEDWADHTVTVDGDVEEVTIPGFGLTANLHPPITTTHTVSGDVITVNVSAKPGISYLYLIQVTGALPRTQIPMVDGNGSFKIITTGLESGDDVVVKIGYKFWSNQEKFTLTLP